MSLHPASEQYELYSPWPELADNTTAARCQPLINAVYLPTPHPDRYLQSCANGTSSIIEWVILEHEFTHLRLNSTPLKEVARLYLGRIYDSLEELLRIPEDQWSEATTKSFTYFRMMHKRLSGIFARMTFIEELLVTAFTFINAEVVFQNKFKNELSKLEGDSIDVFKEQFPGFQILYYSIKEMLRLADNQREKSWLILVWLGIFLQPIDIATQSASKVRCKTLIDYMRPMRNYTQLLEWLERQICDPSFIQAWQTILLLSMQYSQQSKNMRLLGNMSMANRLLTKKEVNFEDVVDLIREIPNQYVSWPHSGGALLPQVFLYPKKQGNTQYIVPFNAAGNYNKYLDLLSLESVRQQLSIGMGIRYPFLPDGTEGNYSCTHQPQLKQGIKRFARWAMEGRFGPGKWTDGVSSPFENFTEDRFLATTEQ